METHRPSLSELRAGLESRASGLRTTPLLGWLSEGAATPADIGEIVTLMLDVELLLENEVDRYVERTVFMADAAAGGGPNGDDPSSNLLDLTADESESPDSPYL